jgi:hypothetical protein
MAHIENLAWAHLTEEALDDAIDWLKLAYNGANSAEAKVAWLTSLGFQPYHCLALPGPAPTGPPVPAVPKIDLAHQDPQESPLLYLDRAAAVLSLSRASDPFKIRALINSAGSQLARASSTSRKPRITHPYRTLLTP